MGLLPQYRIFVQKHFNIYFMENLKELLKNRRSIRKYTEDSISPENVKEILEAALMSPTSKRSLCWEFVVIENPEQLEKLSHCKAQGAKPVSYTHLALPTTQTV